MSRSCLRGLALAAPAAFVLALLATPSSAVQRTVTIYQIQDTTLVGHVNEGSPDTITTSGIITGADIRTTGFGYYIEDAAGGNFSGVQVFTGGTNAMVDSGYALGDIIQATGKVFQFQGGTEIIGFQGGTGFGAPPRTSKIGTAPVPAPLAVTFPTINELASYGTAERYEGVLVALTGTGRTARNTGVGTSQYLIVDSTLPSVPPMDSVRIDAFTLAYPELAPPALGLVVSNVKGIANQSSPRGYHIELRDGADITQPSPPALLNAWATSNTNIRLLFDRSLDPSTATDVGNYSRATLKAIDSAALVGAFSQTVDLTTAVDPQVPAEAEEVTASGVKSALGDPMAAAAKQAFRAGISPITAVQTNFTVNPPFHPALSDSSQFTFQQVTVRGVITAKDNQTYYMQNGTSTNPSSGLIVFAPPAGLHQGDDMTISGTITEFGGASQATEINVDYLLTNATGVALPAPVVVSPGAVGALTGSEPFPGEAYEAMLIKMNNVVVYRDSLPNGQYLVGGLPVLGDTVRVDDNMYHHIYRAGTTLSNVTGVVNDAFGQYVVLPRSEADVESVFVTGVDPGAGALEFALKSISPSPVSFSKGGSAVLRFNLPTAGKISLRVYDVTGRLVAEPANDAAFDAGSQTLALDGRTRTGERMRSGIFFVQLKFGNRVATGKFVVAE